MMAWSDPPGRVELDAGGVDVWRLSLDAPAGGDDHLNAAERERAQRFRFDKDRICYTATRSALRGLLAAYLEALGAPTAAGDLVFEDGAHGKPALADAHQPDGAPVEFNVTHSGQFSLLAFSRGRPVGVDVEQVRPRKSLELVAEHHFADTELAAVLAAADTAQRRRRFYRVWTRKEAYMKATGKGLALGLKTFAVGVDEARLSWTEAGDAGRWQICDVDPGEGYVGALCVGGGVDEVRLFDGAC